MGITQILKRIFTGESKKVVFSSWQPTLPSDIKLEHPVLIQISPNGNYLWFNDASGCKVRICGLNSKHVNKSKVGSGPALFIDIKIEEN